MINTTSIFDESSVDDILSLVASITTKCDEDISLLRLSKNAPEIQVIINKWSDKIRKLGGVPLSLYSVKFKSANDSFYLWELGKELLFISSDSQ